MNLLKKEGFLFVFIISLVATLGSLYFSEIRGYIPCKLCWYQRILMYPIVIISIVSYAKQIRHNYLITMIMSGIGLCISAYHYSMQKIPSWFSEGGFCGDTSCMGQYINWFGFVTIPFLALIAFILIFIVSFMAYKQTKEQVNK